MSESEENPPGRLYRVVKSFRWLEGGKPGPGWKAWREGGRWPTAPEELWEGGRSVVYEPGDTAFMEDKDLANKYAYLEAIDEAGRDALENARAEAEEPADITFLSDLDSGTVEGLTRTLEEKRKGRVENSYAVDRDGTTYTLISSKVYPANPIPGVIYDDNGLPLPYETALRREREEMERKLAAVHAGARKGGKRARDTRQDKGARRNEALLADVRAYRAKHKDHGFPSIAEALVAKHGRKADDADPRGREKAIDALRKRIERLEKKSLDR